MLPITSGEFRAGADANLRYTPSGVAVAKVRAVASSRKQVDGEWQDDKTCWVDVICFKRLAENVGESITKGTLFNVTGKLQTSDWEDKDGNKRTSLEIVADTVSISLAFDPIAGGGAKTERVSGGNSREEGDPWQTGSQDDEPPF